MNQDLDPRGKLQFPAQADTRDSPHLGDSRHSLVRIQTGSRLHFGLYRFAPQQMGVDSESPGNSHDCMDGSPATNELEAQLRATEGPAPWFGGIGMMVQTPATVVELTPSRQLQIENDTTLRVQAFVERWWAAHRTRLTATTAHHLPVHINIERSPPQHMGLGAGTQLALAVGQALSRFFLDVELAPEELARTVGRGLRSAVGTHGFFRGGVIVDRGKTDESSLGTLDGAFPIPPEWRVILIGRTDLQGIHGQRELSAFRNLPPIPDATTQRLQRLTRETIVPALLADQFDVFAEGIYQYGLAAGECFRQIQGGPFASSRATEVVKTLRAWGVAGVGQSSWGPCLFCFIPDPDQASSIVTRLQSELLSPNEYLVMTQPQNGGYQRHTEPA